MLSIQSIKRISCVALLCSSSYLMAQSATAADKHFVREAIEGSTTEVQLGKLAAEKSPSADVRDFGQKMVDDHTKLGNQMREVARQVGVTPSVGISVGGKALETALKMFSGETFDKAYLKVMVKDHQEDVEALTHEANLGTSPVVRDAAKEELEVVSAHLKMVEALASAHHVGVEQDK